MKLPDNIEGLIKAQNEFDSKAFAAFFTERATIYDEGSSHLGRNEIRQWIQQTTEKYNTQLKPIGYNQNETSAKLTVEVTGTFPGSSAVMQYHLGLKDNLISSLKITG